MSVAFVQALIVTNVGKRTTFRLWRNFTNNVESQIVEAVLRRAKPGANNRRA